MRAAMSHCKAIHKTLVNNGWVLNKSQNNADGFKLDGQTGEGHTTVCVLDIALQLPDNANCEDVNEIMDFIEESQRKRVRHEEFLELNDMMSRGENLTDTEMRNHNKLSNEFRYNTKDEIAF